MTLRAAIMKLVQQDDVNFVLTNIMPRRLVSTWMGRFSRIENPLICDLSLRVWRFFSDLDLSDAREDRFASMHHCFTRRLKEGARPVEMDPGILVSPCDAIVGACGRVDGDQLLQVKGITYSLTDLFGDAGHAAVFRGGSYVTLRLTSAMYHHFHAPQDCRVTSVTHIDGDVWNVNAAALQRVARLFCRNERALIRTSLSAGGDPMTLVAVAAILVSGIRLRFLDLSQRRVDRGRQSFSCNASLRKGEEMGWFEHGSTILVFVPEGYGLCDGVSTGASIRCGAALMTTPDRTDMRAIRKSAAE